MAIGVSILQIDLDGKTEGKWGFGLQDSSGHPEMALLRRIFLDHDILDMDGGCARSIDPLSKKPTEVSSSRLRKNLEKIIPLQVGSCPFLNNPANPVEKCQVSHFLAEHVKHQGCFLVSNRIIHANFFVVKCPDRIFLFRHRIQIRHNSNWTDRW